ncbi:hypothetical protein IE4803_PA00381 (plasmid) [Rhizobium etli bv. phaseoli str. IE4803]|nr:hypothetical protein IE4803_PA00381 [Rhizobium etli bv. phaseoli str. IE4803]
MVRARYLSRRVPVWRREHIPLVFYFIYLFLNINFFMALMHNLELRKSKSRLFYRKLYSFIILDKS